MGTDGYAFNVDPDGEPAAFMVERLSGDWKFMRHITVADGKILSPQQPTRLFQSLDYDDSEPILKTRIVNALAADGWRFFKPPPFCAEQSKTLEKRADCSETSGHSLVQRGNKRSIFWKDFGGAARI